MRALPMLGTVEFTNADDKRLAAAIPNTGISIAELAKHTELEVAVACQRLWEFVSLGLVEVE